MEKTFAPGGVPDRLPRVVIKVWVSLLSKKLLLRLLTIVVFISDQILKKSELQERILGTMP